MNVTGVVSASRSARAASPTCMRACSCSKLGRPDRSRATISPSSTVSVGSSDARPVSSG